MPLDKIYFDASILFAALYSKTGGSYKLARLSEEKKIIALTSQTVIDEVKANIKKFKEGQVDIGLFIKKHNFYVREVVTQDEIEAYKNIVAQKDAHVLVGAASTESDYLVTLDKKHINKKQVKGVFTKSQIVSPKQALGVLRKKGLLNHSKYGKG